MFKYRAVKYGFLLSSASAAAYYRQDINDSFVGVVRFGRAAITVSTSINIVCIIYQEI